MRGRPLSDLEHRHLKHLFHVRQAAHDYADEFDAEIEDFVLELRDSGASARGLAELLGVSSSTIQVWTKNARQRRDA